MNNIVYLKEPGILYDMLFALKLRFNGERAYLPLRTGTSLYDQNENLYRLIIERLSDISDKLLPFFYYDKDKDISTGMVTYVREYINLTAFQESGLIEHFYTTLRDINRLKQSIYKNYISDDCPDDFDKNTLYTIKDNLFNADLPSDVKMYLLGFLLYGEYEIEEIIAEFRNVESICRELNQIHQSEIEQLFDRFESEHLRTLSALHCIDISQYENVYVTYCSVNIVAASFEKDDRKWLSVLGLQIHQLLAVYYTEIEASEIDLLGLSRVLYDEQRLRILDMLVIEDMYCAQIAKKLGLKSNSTIYHLNHLETEGLIINYKIGRKIYYKINNNYFCSVIDYLKEKFVERKKNEE